jgi:hypothetical protein
LQNFAEEEFGLCFSTSKNFFDELENFTKLAIPHALLQNFTEEEFGLCFSTSKK